MSTPSPQPLRRKAKPCKPKRLVRPKRLMDVFQAEPTRPAKPFSEGLRKRCKGGDNEATQEMVQSWSESEELQKLGLALAGGIGKRGAGALLPLPSPLLPPL